MNTTPNNSPEHAHNNWFKSLASLTAGPAKAGPLTKRYAQLKSEKFMERDIQTALFISAAAPTIVMLNGDYLYIGLWYYILLPALLIAANYFLKTPAHVCSGMALALQLSFFVFFYWQFQINQGLLGLIHLLFLLPGATISSIAGFILLKNSSILTTINGFAYGFCSFAIGAATGMTIYLSS